jgi:hypothetical protein
VPSVRNIKRPPEGGLIHFTLFKVGYRECACDHRPDHLHTQDLFNGIEQAPLPRIFTVAPLEDPTSPEAELTAFGRGRYLLARSGAGNDIILLDTSNNPTGGISQAVGVLEPQLNTASTG